MRKCQNLIFSTSGSTHILKVISRPLSIHKPLLSVQNDGNRQLWGYRRSYLQLLLRYLQNYFIAYAQGVREGIVSEGVKHKKEEWMQGESKEGGK